MTSKPIPLSDFSARLLATARRLGYLPQPTSAGDPGLIHSLCDYLALWSGSADIEYAMALSRPAPQWWLVQRHCDTPPDALDPSAWPYDALCAADGLPAAIALTLQSVDQTRLRIVSVHAGGAVAEGLMLRDRAGGHIRIWRPALSRCTPEQRDRVARAFRGLLRGDAADHARLRARLGRLPGFSGRQWDDAHRHRSAGVGGACLLPSLHNTALLVQAALTNASHPVSLCQAQAITAGASGFASWAAAVEVAGTGDHSLAPYQLTLGDHLCDAMRDASDAIWHLATILASKESSDGACSVAHSHSFGLSVSWHAHPTGSQQDESISISQCEVPDVSAAYADIATALVDDTMSLPALATALGRTLAVQPADADRAAALRQGITPQHRLRIGDWLFEVHGRGGYHAASHSHPYVVVDRLAADGSLAHRDETALHKASLRRHKGRLQLYADYDQRLCADLGPVSGPDSSRLSRLLGLHIPAPEVGSSA